MFWYGELAFSGVPYSISSCTETGFGYQYCLHYRETQSGKSRLIAEFGLYGELLLSMAVRRLPGDWKEWHGLEPILAEAFVDPAKYRGTCYRAANWQCIGRTKGRKASASEEGRTPKDVYLYPMTKDGRQVLLTGSRRSGCCSRRSPAAVFAPEDAFIRLWQQRRVLNTLVVVLFIFRLVFSKGRPGYATTLAELWGQCRTMGIELPQPAPVPPSSICSARAKLEKTCSRPGTRKSSRCQAT